MTSSDPRRRWPARLALGGASLGLGACSVIAPSPTLELVKAAGAAATYSIATGPSKAVNTVYHLRAPVNEVCIEFNPDAQIGDVVPSIQALLKDHRVDSRVYANGTPTSTCSIWLNYIAYVDWGMPPFDDKYKSYLRMAALTLRTGDGRLLSTSSYELEGFFAVGKWSPTRSKLAPVVAALLTGVEG